MGQSSGFTFVSTVSSRVQAGVRGESRVGLARGQHTEISCVKQGRTEQSRKLKQGGGRLE